MTRITWTLTRGKEQRHHRNDSLCIYQQADYLRRQAKRIKNAKASHF